MKVYLPAILLSVAMLSGCGSTSGVKSAAGPCLALSPHFPQRTYKQDHDASKVAAYRRNVAYGTACPGQMPRRKR